MTSQSREDRVPGLVDSLLSPTLLQDTMCVWPPCVVTDIGMGEQGMFVEWYLRSLSCHFPYYPLQDMKNHFYQKKTGSRIEHCLETLNVNIHSHLKWNTKQSNMHNQWLLHAYVISEVTANTPNLSFPLPLHFHPLIFSQPWHRTCSYVYIFNLIKPRDKHLCIFMATWLIIDEKAWGRWLRIKNI